MSEIKIGIDVGGTYTKISVYCMDKKEFTENIIFKTSQEKTKKFFLENLIFYLKEIQKKNKNKKIKIITIALPGLIENQKIVKLPNIEYLNNFDLKKELEEKFSKTKITIIKDSNSIYYYIKNSLKPKKNIAVITLGTSIACNLILNGRIYLGRGNSGEIAHNFFSSKELEELISSKNLLKELQKIDKSIEKIEDLNYKKNIDLKIKKLFKKYGENIGLGLSHLHNILDLDSIILTGGMIYNEEFFLKDLIKIFEKKSFVKPCKIEIIENNQFIGSQGCALK